MPSSWVSTVEMQPPDTECSAVPRSAGRGAAPEALASSSRRGLVAELTFVRINDLAAPPEPTLGSKLLPTRLCTCGDMEMVVDIMSCAQGRRTQHLRRFSVSHLHHPLQASPAPLAGAFRGPAHCRQWHHAAWQAMRSELGSLQRGRCELVQPFNRAWQLYEDAFGASPGLKLATMCCTQQ